MPAALPPKPQQLPQTRQRTAMLQELMPPELLSSSATLNIHAQTNRQESLQLLRQLLGLLEPRGAIRRDQVKRLQGLLVQVRGFGLDHLDGHDAQRPDVDFTAVFLLLDDLGRHPVWGADHGGALAALLGQFGAEAEVGDLDGSAGGEQDVVGFDVAVDDVLAVQVDEALAGLVNGISEPNQ